MTLTAVIFSLEERAHGQHPTPEEVGSFALVNGRIEARFPGDPDHHPPGEGSASPRDVLDYVRAQTAWVDADREEQVTADADPERWLRGLPITYHGSYFWASLREIP